MAALAPCVNSQEVGLGFQTALRVYTTLVDSPRKEVCDDTFRKWWRLGLVNHLGS